MLLINNDYLKSHKCYVGENTPKYIVMHETDNWDKGAGAIRHGMCHVNGNGGNASVHFFVDDSNIVQTLRLEDGSWAIGDGDGSSGISNRNSINIEICVNPDSDYNKAYNNAVDLVNYLMSLLGLGVESVKSHYDATGKWCPRKILDNNLWENFKSRLKVSTLENKTEGYIVTNYLPVAWEGYEGIDLNYVLSYFNDIRCYMRHNNKGMWIETQALPMKKCLELKDILGSWFYSIE